MPKVREMVDLSTDPETGYEQGFDIAHRLRVQIKEESESCGREGLQMTLDRMLGYTTQDRRRY